MRRLGLLELGCLPVPLLLVIDVPRCCLWQYQTGIFFVYYKKYTHMENETVISPELQKFMKLNNIEKLQDLLIIEDKYYLEMAGFGWRILREILELRDS